MSRRSDDQVLAALLEELAQRDATFAAGVLAAGCNELCVRTDTTPRELYETAFKAAPTDEQWLELVGRLQAFRTRLRRAIR